MHFKHLFEAEDTTEGDYTLIVGQVPRDAALRGKDLTAWYVERAQEAREAYRKPVFFRPHPKAPHNAYCRALPVLKGSMRDALARAHAVVTFNSNTGVLAALAGKRTVAWDEGSMVWELCAHEVDAAGFVGDREQWANELAWRQWRLEEIADGSALDVALEGLL